MAEKYSFFFYLINSIGALSGTIVFHKALDQL